jgi:hypothetical protein
MACVTIIALGTALWLRFGPAPRPEPPGVGKVMPALRLLDPETGKAVVLPGLRGKIVWVTFLSLTVSSGRADLDDLERIWKRFRSHERFAMAAVAVDSDRPDLLRTALHDSGVTLPAYLAAPGTSRAVGAEGRALPLHILIDETGHIIAILKGKASLDALADQVEERLEELEPPPLKKRFALARPLLITEGRETRFFPENRVSASSLPRRDHRRNPAPQKMPGF